jgi:FeS assembly protein SufD
MYDQTLFKQVTDKSYISDEIKTYKEERYQSFDALSFPTWKRMKVKNTEAPDFAPYNNQKVMFHQEEGLSVKPLQGELPEVTRRFDDVKYGPSEKHRLLTEVFSNSGNLIEVERGKSVSEPVVLQYEMNSENPVLLDHNIFHVKEGAALTVVIDYRDHNEGVYHNGLLNIVAEQGSSVKIVKIQNLHEDSTHIYSAVALIHRDASVSFSSIDLGSGLTVTDYSTYLLDENSHSQVESIYLGDGKRKIDTGYNTTHIGRRSTSDLVIKGALLDESRKVFRGNLFFEKGAARAKGAEQEYVILLDKRVQSDAIPALMCSEDDVQGEHAASAGQIEENKLFYLMSRGLSEKESKQLIIMASFAPIMNQLPIEGLKTRIEEEVQNRLSKEL